MAVESVRLEGMERLKTKFKMLIGVLDEAELENRMVKGAEVIRDDARGRVRSKKGNLERGIVAKKFAKQHKGEPAAFVAIDYSVAPHGHLVEFGHGGPHPAGPHPFFRPAVDVNRSTVRRIITKGVEHVINKEAKSG